MLNRKCPYCEGTGGDHIKEGPHAVHDSCYACGTTGWVTEERYQQYRFECLVASVSRDMVNQERRACNEDPEGEGWNFLAAENGLTGWEYAQEREAGHYERAGRELATVAADMLQDLIDRVKPDDLDPEKTVIYRIYRKEHFPTLTDAVALSLLNILYPARNQCPSCGDAEVYVPQTVMTTSRVPDDMEIPF